MSETSKTISKKSYLEFKEVEVLYGMVYKYSLREEAYKSLLQFYIKFKESADKT